MPPPPVLPWRSLGSGIQEARVQSIPPRAPLEMGGRERGARAGIIEAARVDGRGARRERHFGFGNKKKT